MVRKPQRLVKGSMPDDPEARAVRDKFFATKPDPLWPRTPLQKRMQSGHLDHPTIVTSPDLDKEESDLLCPQPTDEELERAGRMNTSLHKK